MADVDDVNEEVGVVQLFERGAERGHERGRQLVHEAHRVGEEHRRAAAEGDPSRRGIERRERLVGDEHVRIRERVHERGFPGVRVAHERREEQPFARPRAARPLALLRHLAEALAQLLDALADDLAVALELRLAGAARADATAEARELLALAGEARQPVLELRELYLDATLPRARVAREDVEDHRRPIDDPHSGELLERASGREDLGDADLFELRDVRVGNDPAGEHHDVVELAFAHHLHDAGEQVHVGAGEDRKTDRIDVFLERRAGDLLRGLAQPGVDDFHSGVTQRAGDHLDSAVVAVQAGLGEEDPYLSFRHGGRYQ